MQENGETPLTLCDLCVLCGKKEKGKQEMNRKEFFKAMGAVAKWLKQLDK